MLRPSLKKETRGLGRARVLERTGLFAVAADGFHRATFHGFLALRLFLRGRGLLENVGVPPVIVAREIVRRGLAAEITIDALVVDVILAGRVLRVFIRNVSHKIAF